jgi:general secretion pathway protein G
MNSKRNRLSGFSLLELIVVVVIIGIIAAVAIPRLSRGSAGASDSALSGDLAVLRNAIDVYSAEHGGSFPTQVNVVNAMTQYTDASGATATAKDATHIYGPYVRKIPPLPVGVRTGCSGIAAADATGIGWIYDPVTGNITANTSATESDVGGKLYNTY